MTENYIKHRIEHWFDTCELKNFSQSGSHNEAIFFYKFTDRDIATYTREKIKLPKDGGLYYVIKWTKTKMAGSPYEDYKEAYLHFVQIQGRKIDDCLRFLG